MSTPSSKEKYSSCRLFFLERAKSPNNENTVNPSTPRHPLPVSPAFTHMLPARLIPPTSPTTQKLLAPYSRRILCILCEPLQLNGLEGNCNVNIACSGSSLTNELRSRNPDLSQSQNFSLALRGHCRSAGPSQGNPSLGLILTSGQLGAQAKLLVLVRTA